MAYRNIICFHNPDEDYGYLSNWYLSDFNVDGISFSSMEQYMMYQKAMLFHDEIIASKILATQDVAIIKSLGRKVSNYQECIWNGMRQICIYQGLLEKFKQNPHLKDKLLQTEDAILVECALKDRIWGNGMTMEDERRYDINQWNGQNLLGFALMQVRAQLKK